MPPRLRLLLGERWPLKGDSNSVSTPVPAGATEREFAPRELRARAPGRARTLGGKALYSLGVIIHTLPPASLSEKYSRPPPIERRRSEYCTRSNE